MLFETSLLSTCLPPPLPYLAIHSLLTDFTVPVFADFDSTPHKLLLCMRHCPETDDRFQEFTESRLLSETSLEAPCMQWQKLSKFYLLFSIWTLCFLRRTCWLSWVLLLRFTKGSIAFLCFLLNRHWSHVSLGPFAHFSLPSWIWEFRSIPYLVLF